jgi:hypothetical protein
MSDVCDRYLTRAKRAVEDQYVSLRSDTSEVIVIGTMDYSLSESRKIIFLAWVTRTCRQFRLARTYTSREGDMLWGHTPRGGVARTYISREGDMSWGQLVPVLTDNL